MATRAEKTQSGTTSGLKKANVGHVPSKKANIAKAARPVGNKAASIAGDSPSYGVTSAYAVLANRLANRVAEIAESITIVER